MKKNYDFFLKKHIKTLNYKPSLLLHVCCAPCSTYVIDYLKDYFLITAFFYNPNIEPREEYEKRRQEFLSYLKKINIDYIDSDYDNEVFSKKVKYLREYPEGGIRCGVCFSLRLLKTKEVAEKNSFEYFATSLTISSYKDAKLINKLGLNISKNSEIKYLESDFKKNDGYKKSIELSKQNNLYRQNYCGCLSSKTIKKL